jgi:hypothetical protein
MQLILLQTLSMEALKYTFVRDLRFCGGKIRGFLRYCAMWCGGWISKFRRIVLSPSSGLKCVAMGGEHQP